MPETGNLASPARRAGTGQKTLRETQQDERQKLFEWLSSGIRDEPNAERIFVSFCERLLRCGVKLSRATLHFRVHHPQWLGTRFVWSGNQTAAQAQTIAYDVEATDVFQLSPFKRVIDTGKPVRQRLQICGPHRFPVYDELREAGHTDYIAWLIDHTQGRRHLITLATNASGGFADEETALVEGLLPLFSLITDIRLKNQLASTLLQTYVGPHASQQILDGATTRGSGATVNAAVMMCDLRNFTQLSDRRSRDDVIRILNRYFDVVCEPIERNGGEILKFIGDGLLAIFSLAQPDACARLLHAIHEAHEAASRLDATEEPIVFGTGVHVGEVMYGNIGSTRRLDFTVIGPAVNLASRLEGLTKTLHRRVLMSGEFVREASRSGETEYLGLHKVNGFDNAVEVHALKLPVTLPF